MLPRSISQKMCPAYRPLRSEQLLRRNVKRFRDGLVFQAHRLVYYSTPPFLPGARATGTHPPPLPPRMAPLPQALPTRHPPRQTTPHKADGKGARLAAPKVGGASTLARGHACPRGAARQTVRALSLTHTHSHTHTLSLSHTHTLTHSLPSQARVPGPPPVRAHVVWALNPQP